MSARPRRRPARGSCGRAVHCQRDEAPRKASGLHHGARTGVPRGFTRCVTFAQRRSEARGEGRTSNAASTMSRRTARDRRWIRQRARTGERTIASAHRAQQLRIGTPGQGSSGRVSSGRRRPRCRRGLHTRRVEVVSQEPHALPRPPDTEVGKDVQDAQRAWTRSVRVGHSRECGGTYRRCDGSVVRRAACAFAARAIETSRAVLQYCARRSPAAQDPARRDENRSSGSRARSMPSRDTRRRGNQRAAPR